MGRFGELVRKGVGMLVRALVFALVTVVAVVLVLLGAYALGVLPSPVELMQEALDGLGGRSWLEIVGYIFVGIIVIPLLVDVMDEFAGVGRYDRDRFLRDPRDHDGYRQ